MSKKDTPGFEIESFNDVTPDIPSIVELEDMLLDMVRGGNSEMDCTTNTCEINTIDVPCNIHSCMVNGAPPDIH